MSSTTVTSYQFKIILNIPYKLISAPCKLAEHSVRAFFGLILILNRSIDKIDR